MTAKKAKTVLQAAINAGGVLEQDAKTRKECAKAWSALMQNSMKNKKLEYWSEKMFEKVAQLEIFDIGDHATRDEWKRKSMSHYKYRQFLRYARHVISLERRAAADAMKKSLLKNK